MSCSKQQCFHLWDRTRLVLLGSVIKGTRLITKRGQAKLYFAPASETNPTGKGYLLLRDDDDDPNRAAPQKDIPDEAALRTGRSLTKPLCMRPLWKRLLQTRLLPTRPLPRRTLPGGRLLWQALPSTLTALTDSPYCSPRLLQLSALADSSRRLLQLTALDGPYS